MFQHLLLFLSRQVLAEKLEDFNISIGLNTVEL